MPSSVRHFDCVRGDAMDVILRVNNPRGTTIVHLFKDRQSPTSYKEFTLTVTTERGEHRYVVPASDIQDLLVAIRQARISPFADCPLGLDGTSYELMFEDGMSACSYRWWMSPSSGWQPLAEITSTILHLAQRHSQEYL